MLFIVWDASYSYALPRTATVFTAELYAIWQGIQYCEHQGLRHFAIRIDLPNFITAVGNTDTVDPLLQLSLIHI